MEKYSEADLLKRVKRLVLEEKYDEALEVINDVDVNRVKNTPMMCLIGEVYMHQRQYDAAEEVFLKAYDKTPTNRRILSLLTSLYIEMGEYSDAEYYYKEFISVASRDLQRYILRYKIDKGKGERLSVLIDTLERLKDYEYIEEWAYELASLYEAAKEDKKCISECDEIVLWFGHGEYVDKAVALRCKITGEPLPVLTTVEQLEEERKIARIKEEARAAAAKQEAELREAAEKEAATRTLGQVIQGSIRKEEKPKPTILGADEDPFGDDIFGVDFDSGIDLDIIEKALERQSDINRQNSDPLSAIKGPVDDKTATINALFGEKDIKDEFWKSDEKPDEADELLKLLEDEVDTPEKAELGDDDDDLFEDEVIGDELPDFFADQEDMDLDFFDEVQDEDVKETDNSEFDFAFADAVDGIDTSFEEAFDDLNASAETSHILENDKKKVDISTTEDLSEEVNKTEVTLVDINLEETVSETVDISSPVIETKALEEPGSEVFKAGLTDTDFDQENQCSESAEHFSELSDWDDEDDLFEDEILEEAPEIDLFEDEIIKAPEELSDVAEEFDNLFAMEEQEELPEDMSPEMEEVEWSHEDADDFNDMDELFTDEALTGEEAEIVIGKEDEAFIAALFGDGTDSDDYDEQMPESVIIPDTVKDIFATMPDVTDVKQQLAQTFTKFETATGGHVDLLAPYDINFVVMGNDETVKSQIAIGIAKALNTYGICDRDKIVRATAEDLNNRDFSAVFNIIKGGCLIIERAVELSDRSVNTIMQQVNRENQDVAIVLEGQKEAIKTLWKRYPDLRPKFLNTINVGKYNETELVTLAKGYVEKRGYELARESAIVLRDHFRDKIKSGEVISYDDVMAVIEQGIVNLDKRNMKNLFMTVLDNKYEEARMVILLPEDFKGVVQV